MSVLGGDDTLPMSVLNSDSLPMSVLKPLPLPSTARPSPLQGRIGYGQQNEGGFAPFNPMQSGVVIRNDPGFGSQNEGANLPSPIAQAIVAGMKQAGAGIKASQSAPGPGAPSIAAGVTLGASPQPYVKNMNDRPDDPVAAILASPNPNIRQIAAQVDAPQEAMATSGLTQGFHNFVTQLITRNPLLGGNILHPDQSLAELPWNKPVTDMLAGMLNPVDQAAFGAALVGQPEETLKGIGNTIANTFRSTDEHGQPVTLAQRESGALTIFQLILAGHGVLKGLDTYLQKPAGGTNAITTGQVQEGAVGQHLGDNAELQQIGQDRNVAPGVEGGSSQAGGGDQLQRATPRVTPGVLQSAQRGAGIDLTNPQTWENPRTNLATVKNAFTDSIRNLTRTSPESAQAYAEFVGAPADAERAINTASREMARVGGAGALDRYRAYLTQDNIIGARNRAQGFANDISAMKDFQAEYPGSKAEQFVDHVMGSMPREAGRVNDLIAEHPAEAKQMALDAINGMSKTNDVMSPADYAAMQSHPARPALDAIWDRTIGEAMQRWHEKHGGVFTEALGPSGRYIPLIPEAGGGRAAIKVPFMQAKNLANAFRTGTGEYTLDPETFKSTLQNRFRRSGQSNFIAELNRSGVVRPPTPADYNLPRGKYPQIAINGLAHDADIVPTSPLRMVKNAEGGMVPVKSSAMVIPKWLMHEVGPGLEPGAMSKGVGSFIKASSAVTKPFNWVATKGLGESIFHGRAVVLKSWKAALGVDHPLTWVRSFFESPQSPANQVALKDMARNGELPLRSAENIGSQSLNPFYRAVFGDRGLDIRSRIAAHQVAVQVADRAGLTGAQRLNMIRDRVNRIGAYNMALESDAVRALKASGINQFATSGMTGLRAKANTGLLNLYPLEAKGAAKIPYVLKRQIMASGAGLVGSWFLIHHLLTGKTPDEAQSPFLEIPLDKLADATGQEYFRGKSLNLAGADPIGGGGLSLLGVKGGYNTNAAKGKAGFSAPDYQGILAGIKDAVNAGASIVDSGPPAQFASNLADTSPVISALVSDKGKPGASMMPSGSNLPLTKGSIAQALWGLNPTTALIGEKVADQGPEWLLKNDRDKGNMEKAVDGVLTALLPGMLKSSRNMAGTGRYLRKQEMYMRFPNIPTFKIDQAMRAGRSK